MTLHTKIGNATNLSESYSVLHLMSSINSTSVQETTVRFLGWEDPLEKGQATHSSISWASLVAQLVKNPPAMLKTLVQSLVWEDHLEKGTATHSSILA